MQLEWYKAAANRLFAVRHLNMWLHLPLSLLLPGLAWGHIFNLSTLDWTLRNENGSIVIPGAVPSQAHLDLLRAGIITEPLLGANGTDCTRYSLVPSP